MFQILIIFCIPGSIIRKDGEISTVKQRFLRAYSRCDPVMLGSSYIRTSAYLVYPTVLEYNDNGKTAVKALYVYLYL